MSFLIAIASFAVAIGVLVIVHELGHYSVARLCGVTVLRFSIGFGKRILTWRSPRTGTEWTVSALPLGGYVKMLDEREAEQPLAPAALAHAFNRQPVARRFAIVAAGPVANFLLAIALFAAVFSAGVNEPAAILAPPPAHTPAALAGLDGGMKITGLREVDDDVVEPVLSWSDLRWKLMETRLADGRAGRTVVLITGSGAGMAEHTLSLAAVSNTPADKSAARDEENEGDDLPARLGLYPGGGPLRLTGIEPGSAAARAGLQPGDTLVAVDGAHVTNASEFVARVRAHPGQAMTVDIERNTQPRRIRIVPDAVPADPHAAPGNRTGRIGASLADSTINVNVRYAPLDAMRLAVHRTWELSAYTLRMFGRMIVGQASLKNLSGPVTIADYAGRSARLGWASFASFLALVSISLGVLNLLPIPVLDGGHLLYYAAEAATGRAVSERWQSILQRVGIICILALSVLALVNDLTRLIHF